MKKRYFSTEQERRVLYFETKRLSLILKLEGKWLLKQMKVAIFLLKF